MSYLKIITEPKKLEERGETLFNIKPIGHTGSRHSKDAAKKQIVALSKLAFPSIENVDCFLREIHPIRTMKSHGDFSYAVSFSDSHIPYHDQKLLFHLFEFLRDIQPEYIIVAGDVIDFPSISKFDKSLKEESRAFDDICQARAFLALIKMLCPHSKLIFIHGNHEYRWQKWWRENTRRSVGIIANHIIPLEKLFGLWEFGYQVFAYGNSGGSDWFKYKDILWCHDRGSYSKYSGFTAKNAMDKTWGSFVLGHVHRQGMHYRTNPTGEHYVGIEQGCTCNLNPGYTIHPDWQRGFCVVKFHKNRERAVARNLVEYIDGGFVWGERAYGF